MHHKELSIPQNAAGVSEDVLFDELNDSIVVSRPRISLSHLHCEGVRHEEEIQVREARSHFSQMESICGQLLKPVCHQGTKNLSFTW